MRDLWTFENQLKLDAFVSVLRNNDVPYQVLLKSTRALSESGQIISVDEGDYAKARNLLKIFRRNSTNRTRK